MKFRERVARFMQGRYGIDELYYCFLLSGLALMLIRLFFHRFAVVYIVLGAVSTLLFCFGVWRCFSRNILRRRAENQRFLRIKDKCLTRFRLWGNKVREAKTHVFRRCKKCKAVLRLPRKRGRHGVTCPCCHQHFLVFIAFGKK